MDFLGIGPVEILFTAIIALIVLGPAKMMEVTRSLGKLVREVRRTTSDLPNLLAIEERATRPPSEGKGGDAIESPGSSDVAGGEEKPGEG